MKAKSAKLLTMLNALLVVWMHERAKKGKRGINREAGYVKQMLIKRGR